MRYWQVFARAFTFAGLAAGLLLCQNGCLGYRFGTSLPPNIRSVHVPTIENKCDEPGLELTVTRVVLQEFQREGSLRAADADKADVILKVTVTGLDLKPLRFSGDLLARATGKIIVRNDRVIGRTNFTVAGDITAAKLRAFPIAAQDLARRIIENAVEAW